MVNLYNLRAPLDFNRMVVGWLEERVRITNHVPPKTFRYYIPKYIEVLNRLEENGETPSEKMILNYLTEILLNTDIRPHLEKRLESDSLTGGFRTAITQSMAKNAGENFVNLIVYNLDRVLNDTGICVEKGAPPALKEQMVLERNMFGETLTMSLETDICIFNFHNPLDAIVINAKTRLKEIFHVGTMWKLLFDIARSQELLDRWNFQSRSRPLENIQYCFATADLVPPGGRRSQGPDVEVDDPRNLIKADASFFDFVFVSKGGIRHTAREIPPNFERTAFFHELASLYDLIEHKFGLDLF